MRSMSYETRSVIAKECILRVCEAAGIRSHTEYAELSLDPRVQEVVKMLDPEPDMTHSLSNVTLTVSVSSLNLTLPDTGEVSWSKISILGVFINFVSLFCRKLLLMSCPAYPLLPEVMLT